MQQSVAADAVEPFCGMRILPGEPAEIGQAGRMECPVTEYETPAQCPDDKQPEDCAQCSNDFLISLFHDRYYLGSYGSVRNRVCRSR